GRLAADILGWLQKHRPGLLANLAYWIIEPSVARQKWQQESLHRFEDSVRWVSDWNTLGPDSICGVIFANELLDSFPVHRIAWDSTNARWFEWGVTCENGEFVWCKLPEQDRFPWPELSPELRAALPDGFTTEVGIAAPAWWKQAADALKQGRLLTVYC
ncbi:MAG: SAM-dependent methyltransferase, partial [Deltaproteobacteria bacterium]|nr:SAM-dependent methyltransferase [Deltaproteobacteria bacterium]